MSLRVHRVFGHASVQGHFRSDRRKFGVPAGGPFDAGSAALANAMVGNEPEASVLELGLCQLSLLVTEESHLAWAGGPLHVTVRGQIVPCPLRVSAGAVVNFSAPEVGARRWVAVRGGFVESIPGPLSVGDLLEIGDRAADSAIRKVVPEPLRQFQVLRAIGERREFRRLFENVYTVRHDSNRVGIRLAGPRMAHRLELPSEPAVMGVVQITPDGLPIVLGPDGPTIGGYPRAAVVASVDWPLLAQLRPGSQVQFVPVTVAAARRALMEEVARYQALFA